MFIKQEDELTVGEIASLLGITESAVRLHISKGTLPAQKRGRRWYIKKTSFEDFVKSQTKDNQ
jgi:excisionase family DNA binding protein